MAVVFASQLGPPATKLTLLAFADYQNDKTGQCNPSFDKLAAKVGISRSQLQKIVASLKADGLLVVLRESTGPGVSPQYELNLERIKTWKKRGPADGAPGGSAHGAPSKAKERAMGSADAVEGHRQCGERGSASAAKGALPAVPKPLLEPEGEPLVNHSVAAIASTGARAGAPAPMTLSDWIEREHRAGNQLQHDNPEEREAWVDFEATYGKAGAQANTVGLDWRRSFEHYLRLQLRQRGATSETRL